MLTYSGMINEQEYLDLQRRTDRIYSLILISDYPEVDIVVERSLFRGEVADQYPESLDLYDQIFESRFDRLWEQFRDAGCYSSNRAYVTEVSRAVFADSKFLTSKHQRRLIEEIIYVLRTQTRSPRRIP